MINKLIEKIRKTNAPIVVGLDPMLNYIPKHIQKKAFAETVMKVRKNSLDTASRNAKDIAQLQEIIKQQAALKQLHISLD